MSLSGVFSSGKVAVITGGADGIGLACARALVADGAAVVLAARTADRLANAADDLRAEFDGATVTTVACDVTDEASVAAACTAAAEVGPLRVVVANAGVGGQRVAMTAVPQTLRLRVHNSGDIAA